MRSTLCCRSGQNYETVQKKNWWRAGAGGGGGGRGERGMDSTTWWMELGGGGALRKLENWFVELVLSPKTNKKITTTK